MQNSQNSKKLYDLLVKVTNVFTDFYVFKHGYIVSSDIEKPFIIQISDAQVSLFEEICGNFKLIRIIDIKNFKKSLKEPTTKDMEKGTEWPKTEDYFYIVDSKTEMTKLINILKEKIEEINSCQSWEIFVLSDDNDSNLKLISSLFKDNNFVNFAPKDNIDGPEIILTKSLLPLVSEKNYTDLFYSSRKVNSNLFLIVFDFQFTLFRLYMFHHYIPMKEDKE